LAWKALGFETVEVTNGSVPLLEDGDATVAGATPIAHYLERTTAGPSIFPEDSRRRNQAVTFDEFADRALGWPVAQLLGRTGGPEIDLEEAPALALPEAVDLVRRSLVYVRGALARGALGLETCHLGDIAVAAHLVTCREVDELALRRHFGDLAEYAARIERLCTERAAERSLG
ncbi:MAG: glutathione S-transferase, partial [Candidatus Binatota bacterium]|nr:glutathione S-transferase [Candidatus Binatota bacterium]